MFTEKEEAVSPQSHSLELAAEGGPGLILGELCELPGQQGAGAAALRDPALSPQMV